MSEATLKFGEAHPMAHSAIAYVRENMTATHMESLASVALSGDRTADICTSTANRLLKGEPVSDRYILGLAWMIKSLVENEQK